MISDQKETVSGPMSVIFGERTKTRTQIESVGQDVEDYKRSDDDLVEEPFVLALLERGKVGDSKSEDT